MTGSDNKFSYCNFVQKKKSPSTFLIGLCFYSLIILIGLNGCTSSMKPQLQQAEELLSTDPDSSYNILNSIDNPKKRSKSEYAIWCLLMTQATDKSDRKHTSDSLIHIAVRYFSEHNEQGRLATAYYTQGRVEKELGYNDKASQSFLKSLDISKESKDYGVQFLAASQLGTLYAYSNLIDKSFDSYQKALHFAEMANDSINLSYAYSYLGRIYGLHQEWSKAEESYKRAISIAESISYIPSLSLGLSGLSSIYVCIEKYTEALICLQKRLKLEKESLSNNNKAATYLGIGDLYRCSKNYDLAVYYLNKALQTTNLYTKRSAYQCFYFLYDQQEDYKKAVEYNNLYWECNDSIRKVEKRQALIEAQEKYNTEKLLMEKERLELKHSRLSFTAITSILFIVIAFLLIYIDKKRTTIGLLNELNSIRYTIAKNKNTINEYRQEMAKWSCLQSELDKLHQVKNDLEQELERLVKDNDSLNKQKNDAIISLKQKDEKIEHYGEAIKHKENIPDIFTRIKQARKIEEKDWPELISNTDALHQQFSERLKKTYPQLLELDVRLCCLIKLGYTRKEQINLLAITEDSLDKRKQRLKKRLDNNRKWRKGDLEDIIKSF